MLFTLLSVGGKSVLTSTSWGFLLDTSNGVLTNEDLFTNEAGHFPYTDVQFLISFGI